VSDAPLASLEIRVPNSDRWGRAFLTVDSLRDVDLNELIGRFNRMFVEEDDVERLALLERAIAHPTVTVETYPGEIPPQELHVYLRVAEVSEHPIFACVLAPPPVVRELASKPPYVVMETASFQAMSGDVTNASVTSAVEAWIRRVWPTAPAPRLLLSPWPGPVETIARYRDDVLERLRSVSSDGIQPNETARTKAAAVLAALRESNLEPHRVVGDPDGGVALYVFGHKNRSNERKYARVLSTNEGDIVAMCVDQSSGRHGVWEADASDLRNTAARIESFILG